MTRRRTLKPEEKELWQSVTRSVNPLPDAIKSASKSASSAGAKPKLRPPAPPPTAEPVRDDTGPPARLPAFRIGEKSAAGAGARTPTAQEPVRMDAKAHGKLKRGKLVPEARIDLHGMTLAEAHPELIRFVLNAHSQGMRLVLVITGKGSRRAEADHGPIPQRPGALRRQVPHWLHQAPLAPAVLQVTEAHLRHGGSGAFYVYLRRQR